MHIECIVDSIFQRRPKDQEMVIAALQQSCCSYTCNLGVPFCAIGVQQRRTKRSRDILNSSLESYGVNRESLGRYCLPEPCSAGLSEPESIGRFDLDSVTGTWKKLPNKSDSMDEACDIVELPWVFRKALKFLNTLVLVDDRRTSFKTVLKAGGIMDVVEEYPWTGDIVKHSRRDKRKGIHTGKVEVVDGKWPSIVVAWDGAFSGTCRDTFVLEHNGAELRQITEMQVDSKRIRYFTVYQRA